MAESVTGVRRDAVAEKLGEARDRSSTRGPSRVAHVPAGLERIRTLVVDDHEHIARLVANRIATLVREKEAAGETAVLGLATGSTPIGVYRELIRMHREEGLSFRHVVTFNLDEYYPMPHESIHSYHRFMWENLFSQIDIRPESVHIPDGTIPHDRVEDYCRRYEDAIVDAGGVDFQILGIGKTGHIGFNEPGSGADSRTRLVTLDAITRRDAAADFFGEEFVPREAITMGVATILDAHEIAILATGEHKSTIVRRAVEGDIDVEVAATFLQRHPDTTFYVDRAAGAELTRIKTPWLLDEVQWTQDLMVRAVIWLSQQTNKAILKLTQRDYAEHKMSALVAKYGTPGEVNGKVFNILGAKIRGKSKLSTHQRIICFSPHPDDDVISMGGILRKLVENENEITIAYQTSGNIAVFDHDVRRYVDFLVRTAGNGLVDPARVESLAATVYSFLERKRPGKVDIQEVQDIKRIIREAEAVSGIETVGLPRSAARFLNLPTRSGQRTLRSSARCSKTSGHNTSSSPATSRIRTARTACAKRQSIARSRRFPGFAPKSGYTVERGRSGRFTRQRGSCRSHRRSCDSRFRRSSSINRRRIRRPSPAVTTSASSGSASRLVTRGRPRSSTSWG